MGTLFEQYRPRTWSDVIGQDKIVARIQQLAKRGLAGRAFWLSGQSGTGKTTIARLIAGEVADEFNTEEIDASALTVAALREIERTMQTKGLGQKTGRAYIVNESHGLRKDVIRQLLVLLERLPSHVVFLFSTTNDNEQALFDECDDGGPLLSRCISLPLSRRDLARPFAERARAIAIAEGLDGKPIEAYVRLIQKHRQNMRAALQEIEAGCMLDTAECAR
jgi:replication-associated recombination protein RarA